MTTAATTERTYTIEPKGPFSLEEAGTFGFGQRFDDQFDGTMRLAFCVDGYTSQAGVAVTQSADGTVHATISGTTGDPDPAGVIAQVARVLSLDHDATGFVALGDQDPVMARLLAAAPGLRPPLFYSPYEAAFWSVLSARRPRRTAEAWRTRISARAGAGFDVAGTEMFALPTPERLLDLGVEGIMAASGIEPARAERVIGVAAAAAAPGGTLDAATLAGLAGLGVDEARTVLRTIPGIGPFYADLIVIRATGVTDVIPLNEPRLQALLGELYQLGGPATPAQVEQLGEQWRPWRTWAAVLVRSAGPRLLT